MSRIIAGDYGGRRLAAPPGRDTRPTSDRTREALFSSLSATHDITAGPFVDLYAGSGAVGLEALSRGAPSVVLVEHARSAARVIEQNVRELAVRDRARVVVAKVQTAIPTLAGLHATTVFADPPYAVTTEEVADVLQDLLTQTVIAAEALVVIERDRRSPWHWPTGYEGLRERRYGETVLWYGRPL